MYQRYAGGRVKASGLAAFIALSAVFPPAGVAALPLASPAAVKLEVTFPTAKDGNNWIASNTEMRAVYPVALEAVRAVLEDYPSAPKFFPRLVSIQVGEAPDGNVVLTQRYEISVIGIKYPTVSTIKMVGDVSGLPRLYRLNWSFVSSDGSMAESKGFWELSDASEGGEDRVSIRHVSSTLVRKDFPAQVLVMKSFTEKELATTLNSVAEEAKKRARS
ncbi:MAG TPA: hypothetical protein DIC34_02550 [Treponema sp.]|nr:MAG: hypothetical protein A2Y36_16585 [Treponema sp. GWA1_62_8]OHE74546.1 MAG: hypothetical protein A2413_01875 [Treponema sp. RIFOXYC1_FULL_61_9]HCM25422.1 hypothetical protein [Treponema sp.]